MCRVAAPSGFLQDAFMSASKAIRQLIADTVALAMEPGKLRRCDRDTEQAGPERGINKP
jgi:hypothetical protein